VVVPEVVPEVVVVVPEVVVVVPEVVVVVPEVVVVVPEAAVYAGSVTKSQAEDPKAPSGLYASLAHHAV